MTKRILIMGLPGAGKTFRSSTDDESAINHVWDIDADSQSASWTGHRRDSCRKWMRSFISAAYSDRSG